MISFIWAVVMGLVGLGFGFFGPIILNPDANQGPLLGIFISGPGGIVIGLILGLIVTHKGIHGRKHVYALSCAAIIFGILTLCWSLPENRYLGFVVDAELRGCVTSESLIAERVEWWKKSIEETKWREPRQGWEKDLNKIMNEDHGTVLDVFVYQKMDFYEGRKPWNKGEIIALSWQTLNKSDRFYARFNGSSCGDYSIGTRKQFFPEWEFSKVSPPDKLPPFLGLYVLSAVPHSLQRFI